MYEIFIFNLGTLVPSAHEEGTNRRTNDLTFTYVPLMDVRYGIVHELVP